MDYLSHARHVSRRELLVLTGAVAGTFSITHLGTDSHSRRHVRKLRQEAP